MTTTDFRPTHVVPQDGLPAWETPDVNRPTVPLDALLPVQLVDRLGDWAQIVCANGWSAWVDGRLLIAVPPAPPAAGHPLTRTADPRPLLARAEEAVGRYRSAAEELSTGGTDGESFRRRTHGLRVGMVVDGESVWLYDAEHERWVYCDGTRLSTYATGGRPSVRGEGDTGDTGDTGEAEADTGGAAGPEPTQVVGTAADAAPAQPPSGEAPAPSGEAPAPSGEAPATYAEAPAPYAEEPTRIVPPAPDPPHRPGEAR
ncbi:hypothetical protein ACGFSB_33855 [Streptomyces sp. NPDC048441]|uniref:hypothetical protein n=1 Tax=Streptomyces sp. NPDC048441 TaxID=3365552 RepID=UPI003712F6C0